MTVTEVCPEIHVLAGALWFSIGTSSQRIHVNAVFSSILKFVIKSDTVYFSFRHDSAVRNFISDETLQNKAIHVLNEDP